MSAPESTPARSASRLEALRAAMERIDAAHDGEVLVPAEPPPPAPKARRAARDPAGARDTDAYAAARAVVLRQLAMAPRSRHQLREKLRQRECPDDVAEAVLDRMAEVGLVDDEKFAEALVRSQQMSRGLSTRALAHELRAKGVDRDISEGVLDQIHATDEEDRARALVDARLPRLRSHGKDVATRRLGGMLARKGYPAGLSLRVIREAIEADPAFRRD